MEKKLRRDLMLKGHFRKRNKEVFDIGSRSFTISNELRKRLRIRDVLLGFFTVIFTFLYLIEVSKYHFEASIIGRFMVFTSLVSLF